MNKTQIYQSAISKWGEVAQMRKANEECCELGAAINQFVDCRIDINALASEVADVEIMIEQMRIMIGEEKVSAAKKYKLDRLADRINDK